MFSATVPAFHDETALFPNDDDRRTEDAHTSTIPAVRRNVGSAFANVDHRSLFGLRSVQAFSPDTLPSHSGFTVGSRNVPASREFEGIASIRLPFGLPDVGEMSLIPMYE
jgi:hypothetical protein